MNEYLNDKNLFNILDSLHIHTHYAKIELLTFKEEEVVREIQGIITSGNLNVNGSSAVRRTINLTMAASINNSNIEDIEKEISINKKIKVYMGIKNITKLYPDEEIFWFPCGLFIISSATISRTTSGWNISITGKDKMCLLDGTVGGMFPASITFNERMIMLKNGDMEIEYPVLFQIIFEAVNHWGGELQENIIISDLDDEVKMLVRYMGDTPIFFSDHYESMSFTESESHRHMFTYGEDVGYKMTSFTYPGELILNAGDTVVDLLNKMTSILGNFEYFYDIDGKFHFQEIKNYTNQRSPLITDLGPEDYVKDYNNMNARFELTTLDTTVSLSRNPKYDNIKNDFYVWGKRKTNSGVEVAIRYHLAIDKKPEEFDFQYANKNMWEVKDKETGLIVRYDRNEIEEGYTVDGFITTLIGGKCKEWREELYRRALDAQVTTSVYDNYYDSELIAEWRNLYDPTNKNWQKTDNWNPDVLENPGKINFWLDFIDTGASLGKYTIDQIGRRTKVVNDSNIISVYNSEVPDVVFFENESLEKTQWLVAKYTAIGQRYFCLMPQYYDMFSISSTGASCFDKIREMLYQNLSYNTTIQISCLPKYYNIEPNDIIHIEDEDSSISGNYQITQYSLPLTYNGTMSITATEVLTRV